jgi:hypothetical protein
MPGNRRVSDPKRAGDYHERVTLRIDWQRGDPALPSGGVAVETRQIGKAAAGFEPGKCVDRAEVSGEFAPVRPLPPFGFFPDQMTTAGKPAADSIRSDEGGVQMIWPRNDEPELCAGHRQSPR